MFIIKSMLMNTLLRVRSFDSHLQSLVGSSISHRYLNYMDLCCLITVGRKVQSCWENSTVGTVLLNLKTVAFIFDFIHEHLLLIYVTCTVAAKNMECHMWHIWEGIKDWRLNGKNKMVVLFLKFFLIFQLRKERIFNFDNSRQNVVCPQIVALTNVVAIEMITLLS